MNEFVIFILPDGSEQKVRKKDAGAFRINNPGSKIKQEDAVDIQLRKQKEQAEKDLSEVVNIDKQGRSLLNQNIPKTSSYYQRLREEEQDLSDAELLIKSKQELANATKQSVDIISDKYKDPDLFSKELISREAQYLGKGVYLPKIEKEVYSVDEKLILKNILAPLRKGIVEINKIVKLESKLETSLKKAKSQLKELGVSEKNIPWVESGENTLRYINDTKKLLKTLDKTEKTLTVN